MSGAAELTNAQEAPSSSVDLIRLEEQRRFERFIYLGSVGIWLTALLLVGVVLSLESQARGAALIWGGVFTALMAGTVITWALIGQHLQSMDARDLWHKVLVILHGLMWALPPFIFFEAGQSQVTMFMLCMVCGMSAAGVPIFGTRPALYAMIFVPPFVAQMIVFGSYGWRAGDAFHGFLGAAMLLLLTVNLIFSRFTWATLNRSIVLAYENQELVQQLKSQAVQLSETTRAAQEANKAKTKFLAAASHDLRQPVHALNLFTEVLASTQLDAKQTHMLQHIRAATHASRDMLNTLLDYSRIEAGVMEAKPAPTHVAQLLRRLEDEFGPQADAQNIIYRTRDTNAMAFCDPSMTLLVLRNFVSNALRYTQTGGILWRRGTGATS
ncbi:MAG: HAMP domain-containing histidine kinase [Brachymonas sp.]|nr:HAMP domain-containing histidine kinase [Brachymonas sp.]